MAAIEAMACSAPVAGGREAGGREAVVEGATGLCVGRDSPCLAAAEQRPLENSTPRDSLQAKPRQYPEAAWQCSECARELKTYLHQIGTDFREPGSLRGQ